VYLDKPFYARLVQARPELSAMAAGAACYYKESSSEQRLEWLIWMSKVAPNLQVIASRKICALFKIRQSSLHGVRA